MSLLISKSTTFELKDFPSEPALSALFYVAHEDPNFINIESYLPPELVVQPPKKIGLAIQYLQSNPAAARKKKVRREFTYSVHNTVSRNWTAVINDLIRVRIGTTYRQGNSCGHRIPKLNEL